MTYKKISKFRPKEPANISTVNVNIHLNPEQIWNVVSNDDKVCTIERDNVQMTLAKDFFERAFQKVEVQHGNTDL